MFGCSYKCYYKTFIIKVVNGSNICDYMYLDKKRAFTHKILTDFAVTFILFIKLKLHPIFLILDPK